MMLPAEMDIFTMNVENFVNSINRAAVFANPFDPQTDDLDQGQASIEPGRAYFVIARNGRNYGFIQIGDNPLLDDADVTIVTFDFRYEDSFVLPAGF